MEKKLLPNYFWYMIRSLLPEHKPSPKGGRPRKEDRACLMGIIYILRTGMPWRLLSIKLGFGSGSTCWRRLAEWTKGKVWPRLHQLLLRALGKQGRIHLERAIIDSASVRALLGGPHTGPNPTDRGKKGCKRHVISDAKGTPLAVQTGPANEPDGQMALTMLEKIPACGGQLGRPRRRPEVFQGDGAYGIKEIIAKVIAQRIKPLLAPYGNTPREHGSGLGKTRYFIEQTLSWFGNFRRLKMCYERTGEHFQAFHELAACIICAQRADA
jgi:transposase